MLGVVVIVDGSKRDSFSTEYRIWIKYLIREWGEKMDKKIPNRR